MLGRVSKLIATVFVIGFVLYVLQWIHVVERFLTICDRNPNFLADCRER